MDINNINNFNNAVDKFIDDYFNQYTDIVIDDATKAFAKFFYTAGIQQGLGVVKNAISEFDTDELWNKLYNN